MVTSAATYTNACNKGLLCLQSWKYEFTIFRIERLRRRITLSMHAWWSQCKCILPPVIAHCLSIATRTPATIIVVPTSDHLRGRLPLHLPLCDPLAMLAWFGINLSTWRSWRVRFTMRLDMAHVPASPACPSWSTHVGRLVSMLGHKRLVM